MKIKFNLEENKRKDIAKIIAETLGWQVKYCGMPSMAYDIGGLILEVDGSIEVPKVIGERILEKLNSYEIIEEIAENDDFIIIEIPAGNFNDKAFENLQKLVESKAELIKIALEINELPIEKIENKIRFKWLKYSVADPEIIDACAILVNRLCETAKTKKWVSSKQKNAVANEKYAFRVWLLSLGFVGEEFANSRATLLKNLNGNASWKNT